MLFIYCTFILSVIYIFVSLTLYFLYLYTCHILFSFIYCACSYTVLSYIVLSYTIFSYTIILYFTSCSCNCILSSHSSVMLLISCYILYAFHLHILVIYFSLSYNVLFIYFSYTVLFHILSYCTFNCILSSHSSAMLLISCHIFYTYHFLLGFMSAYTLKADTRNNYMYP